MTKIAPQCWEGKTVFKELCIDGTYLYTCVCVCVCVTCIIVNAAINTRWTAEETGESFVTLK